MQNRRFPISKISKKTPSLLISLFLADELFTQKNITFLFAKQEDVRIYLILLNIIESVGCADLFFIHKENNNEMRRGLLGLTMRENFHILVHFKGR